ncbi:SdpI family protein [Chitinophaga filiformis]|uniref:SdpI family protein n=1 Tax=Chitinophaga filiformis TaxID=104663 RepID=A0ABY4I577_CHIFI|nr:SdpI family protein [Chitinophaga filiformis]UPK70992.1 SdpI family protein [Chitinophaga filiformis]
MKVNNIGKELPFILLFLMPWTVYLLFREQLPGLVASHYTVVNGKWVADRYSSPLGLLTGLSVGAIVVYLSMSLPAVLKGARPEMSAGMKQWLYYFKLVIVAFMLLLPAYSLLAASHQLPDLSDANIANASMILLVIILNVFLFLLFSRANRDMPKPVSEKYYKIIWAGTHIVTSAGPLMVILSSQGIQAQRLIPELTMLFIAICGNLLYNARPNRYMGIRTPWTLRNEEVWRRTHHVGGIWSFVAGIAGFIVCIFAPERMLSVITPAIAISIGVFCIGYSYWQYRKIVTH